MTDLDVLGRKRSVTRDDIESAANGVMHVLIGPADLNYVSSLLPQTGLPSRSPWTYWRDAYLQSTPLMDGMWAAALKKAISKQVALGWEVEDNKDIATRARRAQALFEGFDGDFEHGIQKDLGDFLTCDNGSWVEIARATRGGASRVEGLYHLDSLRVQRTRDPNIPAYYRTLRGEWKPLPADFVQNFTDTPSPRLELAGVGLCAASVAWDTIVKMQAIETYFREKVSGQNNRAIYLISGVTRKQLKDGLDSADEDAVKKGFVEYKGAVMIAGFDSEKPITVARIDLSSIPDGFDLKEERERADSIYAHASGIFIGDIRPLTGQGLGNGQQARILEESAEGMGLAAWRKQWMTFSKRVNPTTTTFTWSTNDLTDQKKKLEVQAAEIKNINDMIASGLIDVRIGQQMLLDAKILPKELAPPDVTPGGVLTDEDQPSEASSVPELAVQQVVSKANADRAIRAFTVLKDYVAMPQDELARTLDALYDDPMNPAHYRLVESIDSFVQGVLLQLKNAGRAGAVAGERFKAELNWSMPKPEAAMSTKTYLARLRDKAAPDLFAPDSRPRIDERWLKEAAKLTAGELEAARKLVREVMGNG